MKSKWNSENQKSFDVMSWSTLPSTPGEEYLEYHIGCFLSLEDLQFLHPLKRQQELGNYKR